MLSIPRQCIGPGTPSVPQNLHLLLLGSLAAFTQPTASLGREHRSASDNCGLHMKHPGTPWHVNPPPPTLRPSAVASVNHISGDSGCLDDAVSSSCMALSS